MSYDKLLEERISNALKLFPEEIKNDLQKNKMFGGLGILFKGKMTVGIIKNDLVVRVVEEKMEDVLSKAYVRPMDFTKTPMKEFVFVSPKGLVTEEDLQMWIEMGLEHARRKLNL